MRGQISTLHQLPTRRWPARLALALALLTAPAGAAWAQSPATFAAVSTYSTGTDSGPFSVAVADVNGDGLPDIVTTNIFSSTIGVLLGRTVAQGGGFATVSLYDLGSNASRGLAVADVNGDGLPDIVTARTGGSTVGVLLGRSVAQGGGFAAISTYGSGGNGPFSVAVADVDSDGLSDIVTTNSNSSTIGVLLGRTAAQGGGFATASTYSTGSGSNPDGVAVADVNGDGRLDVVTANTSSNKVGVLLGRTTADGGGFANVSLYATSDGNPTRLTVADVNGDGRLDIVTANPNSGIASVLLGRSAAEGGGFAAVSTYSTGLGNSPYSVVVTDVNGDGRPDLVTANMGSNSAGVLLARTAAQGGFATASTFSTGGIDPRGIAVADLNNDGRPDIVTANLNTSTAGVLLNTTPPTLTQQNFFQGPLGGIIELQGSSLQGATLITFSGTSNNTVAASSGFEVRNNGSSIRYVFVPAGAISGPVTVTTATGTSNAQTFTVIRDLVINGPGTRTIEGGTYNSITVNGGGRGSLSIASTFGGSVLIPPPVRVETFFIVRDGGVLEVGGVEGAITGPGRFEVQAGGRLDTRDEGIYQTEAKGLVQTAVRVFASGADYQYGGPSATGVGSGSIILTGDGLPGTVRRLIVDASNLGLNGASTRIRLTQPVNITRELRLNSGTLDLTNETGGFLVTNALTLLSTATSTASVNTNDQLSQGTGLVSGGPVSVQRFVDLNVNESAVSGYRHLSAPVAGATVAMLATSGFAPNVVGGSDYNTSATPGTTSSFPNVFFYDERKQTNVNDLPIFAKGWQAPTAPDEALAAARGYTVQMPGQQTITFSGAPRLAPVSVALTRQSPTAAAGWNLVGNPFAAGFNLVSLAGTANVDDAKYVFESTGPFTGAYRVFLPALPSSGNPIVALGQGFFTRVSTGATAATLTMNVTKTVVDDNTPFRRDAAETRPLVALTLRNAAGTLGDLTTVYADAQATTGFDPRFDAYKLANPSGLNLSQQSADARLAIQGLPALTAAPVVPLNVQVPAAGTYRLQVARLLNLPAGTTATLVDNVTGARLNLAELPAAGHSFTTTGAEVLNTRFVLHFGGNGPLASTSALLAGGLRLSPNPAHGRATVELPAVAGAARVTLTLRDALGRTVRTHTAALPATGLRHELDLSRLAPGVYLLQVQAGAAQTTRRLLVD